MRADLGDAVVDLGDVPQPRGAAAGQRDLRIAELRGRLRAAQHANRLLAAADLRPPARRVQIELRAAAGSPRPR